MLSLPQDSFVIELEKQNENMRPTSHDWFVYVIVLMDDDHSRIYKADDVYRSRPTTHL